MVAREYIPSEHIQKIAAVISDHRLGTIEWQQFTIPAEEFLRCFHAAMELSKQAGIVRVESSDGTVSYQESPPISPPGRLAEELHEIHQRAFQSMITVPREPTPAMLEEMAHAIQMLPGYLEVQSQDEIAKAVWAAGIKAAEG
jgi:hypothetical protein